MKCLQGLSLIIDLLSGYNTYSDFVNLPPRGLKAYYATIEQPMSLKAVQKKIKGQEGRKQGAGTSIYKSWDELEEDISLIWRNARQFNEDGSALFVLAGEFEVGKSGAN